MRFVDEARVYVRAGKGGDGAIAFIREKYRPFGGPAGGDGGCGGSVIFKVDEGMSTLLDFKYNPRLIARDGEPGRGKDQYGHSAADVTVRVPPGTIVFDEDSGATLADLVMPGESAVIAKGGEGGRGNMHFASSTRRSPRIATPGGAGESRWVRMELRLVAEAGLVGLPNAGKSTLLRGLSAARPKVAPYPFTTIAPNIGRVMISDEEGFTVADIPGLIEGAHLGHGLGIRFLRHIARTRILVYVLDVTEKPESAYETVRGEIAAFDPALADRPALIALNKIDIAEPKDVESARRKLRRIARCDILPISADKNVGLGKLVAAIAKMLHQKTKTDEQAACRN
ncbi:MAG TPA: GTPase ObgE [Candidatus Binataceae bacterium]|nr:GTPase ObgE [Candidatus Binataceae bacterium]